MTDLRTRIASVLKAHPDLISGKCHGIEEPELQFEHQDQWADHVADVLIRELAWQEEFRIDIGYGGYESEPSREQALERMVEIIEDWGDDPPETGTVLQHRYVTEWENDDE